MSQAGNAVHEIVLEVIELPGNRRAAVARIPPKMYVGDTVCYSCASPSFRIEFPDGFLYGTSREPKTISDSEIHKLVNEGVYVGRCSITLPEGEVIEWSPEAPESGGIHDVGPK
jgi:hypothetical protein